MRKSFFLNIFFLLILFSLNLSANPLNFPKIGQLGLTRPGGGSASYTASWFSGFETGDEKEILTLGTGASVQSTTARSGGYALKQAATASVLYDTSPSIGTIGVRFGFRKPANPGANQNILLLRESSTVTAIQLTLTTGGNLQVSSTVAGLTTTTGTATLANDTWYTIRVAYDKAAAGVVKVWVQQDGGSTTLDINVTHSTSRATNITRIELLGAATTNEYYFDDIMVASTLNDIGSGRCVSRQGTSVGATYNDFTPNAGRQDVGWMQTPTPTAVSSAYYAESNVSLGAQTIKLRSQSYGAKFVDVSASDGWSSTYPVRGGTATSGETFQAMAMSFTTGTSDYWLNYVDLSPVIVGTSTDKFYLDITATVDGEALGTSFSDDIVEGGHGAVISDKYFLTPLNLKANTKYYFRVFRTGPRDAANYLYLPALTTNPYANHGVRVKSNNAWSSENTNDTNFSIYGFRAVEGPSSSSTINGVKQGMLALRGGGSSHNIYHRRRVNGVNTDTLIGPLTTSSAFYENIWSSIPSLSLIDSAEIGLVRSSGTAQTTRVDEMWLFIDYSNP